LHKKDIVYLSEVMNYPGVIGRDKMVMAKIALAKKYGKKIDGHAPGVTGVDLQKYISAGITTDHESFMLKEGREKISLGMKVQIREGSAAKNFDELARLIDDFPDSCMLCSDDRHPDDLVSGHVNEIIKRGIKIGINKMKLLKCACLNPVLHYGLPVGLLREGDCADFIVVDNLKNFKVLKTYIGGDMVARNGKSLIKPLKSKKINNFKTKKKSVSDFSINKLPEFAIGVIEGQLVTEKVPTTGKDILKIAVVNRYKNSRPAVAFIKGFGLKKGAIASSVAHDSHNIVAVGVSDKDICEAVNLVIKNKGGLAVVGGGIKQFLALPIAGLMSDQNGYLVAKKYSLLSHEVKKLGSKLHAPFMTLAFMALLVIPKLKLSDKGLFDGEKFKFIQG
jgi:adenine deaminase